MDVSEAWGRCSSCGHPSSDEFCNKCDGKTPKEETATLYLCYACKNKYSDVKGGVCEFCQEEAHRDGKCFDKCYICEARILRRDCES